MTNERSFQTLKTENALKYKYNHWKEAIPMDFLKQN